MALETNIAEVVAQVREAFERYERALVGNDVETLDALFWKSAATVRFGATENLYGYDAIAAFRSARSPAGLARTLRNTVITTYGRDFATASTEFVRPSFYLEGKLSKVGRQSQTWVRTEEGWRVAAAHISVLEIVPGA